MMAMAYCKRAMLYLDVIRRLGFWNVAYVAWYRFTLKSGIRKRFFPQQPFVSDGPFFSPVARCAGYPKEFQAALFQDADKIIQGQIRYYAYHRKMVRNPPNWFLNPFNNRLWPNTKRHWADIADFEGGIGDIKNVWEASRFEWVVTLARAYAFSGKTIYLNTLNHWLSDWAAKNPVNTGPNWKCGQEAAMRVFNLMQAAAVLGQWNEPRPALSEFIDRHLERISANIRYAIAQDNNHGTSEAAALFIGGNWLAKTNTSFPRKRESSETDQWKRYDHFASQGRKWLENRVEKLVEEDGSFSQHSVTYHRVLLDTLIFAEHWRKKLGAAPFSATFYDRASAVLDWMISFTDTTTGNALNLGANDGAMLLHAHACDYRDFRPSIQTASVLFCGRKQYANGPWDEASFWLGLQDVAAGAVDPEKTSQVFPGGYVVMAGKNSWAVIRFPMYRFRPGHNDVFHFDLWFKGENICRDGGSYSYNPDIGATSAYFESVKAHNTVAFDDGDQMPRLGRFLFGRWIKADHIGAIESADDGTRSWTGSYRDYRGNRHQRRVSWKEDSWIIEDSFSGGFNKAEVLYRLIPADYRIEGNSVTAPWGRIDFVRSDFELSMSEGFESLYYWQKQSIPVLVVHAGKNCEKITTRFILER